MENIKKSQYTKLKTQNTNTKFLLQNYIVFILVS